MNNVVAEMLLRCEENGSAPPYVVNGATYQEARSPFFGQSLPVQTVPVKYTSRGEEVFVVSDLHIAAGRNRLGVYKGTENFFADESFERFLANVRQEKKTPNALLVINGDIFDFIRITDHPGKVRKTGIPRRLKHTLKFNPPDSRTAPHPIDVEAEYREWSDELARIGIHKTVRELQESISRREKRFGLQTDAYKTVYKMIRIRHGHPAFFTALAQWLAEGNRLIVVKGNHDLELYWLEVRNYLRLILGECIVTADPSKDLKLVLRDFVLPNITFIDDAVEIDGELFIEHGHRYDKFTMVLDGPTLKGKPSQLNIPFGSFFNRYLINRIELYFPFLDNVRPSGNVLPVLVRENFPLALKVFLQHVPLLLRVLLTNLRYTWFMFHKVFWFAVAIAVPVAIGVWAKVISPEAMFGGMAGTTEVGFPMSMLLEQSKSFGLLILSYLLARFVAWFQLEEPSSLDKFARIRFEGTSGRLMTMGHTHNPGAYRLERGRLFYNTGTWVPVIETSTADVREDKTYTFLRLVRDGEGHLQPADGGLLHRWNDDAGRAEPQILLERK